MIVLTVSQSLPLQPPLLEKVLTVTISANQLLDGWKKMRGSTLEGEGEKVEGYVEGVARKFVAVGVKLHATAIADPSV
jgi:hypothetical protein